MIKNSLFYVSYGFGLYYPELSQPSSASAKLDVHCFSIIRELWARTTCEITESYTCTPRERVDEKAEDECSWAGVYSYSMLENAMNVFTNSFCSRGRLEGPYHDKWRFTAIYCAAEHWLCIAHLKEKSSCQCMLFWRGCGLGFKLLSQTVSGVWSPAAAMAGQWPQGRSWCIDFRTVYVTKWPSTTWAPLCGVTAADARSSLKMVSFKC